MSSDTSIYCQISESQERMLIADVYIIGSIGLTISVIILYSLINENRKQNANTDRYYKQAINCCTALAITSIIFYLAQMAFTDLILPNGGFITNNVDFISIIDSIIFILWLLFKILFYYGFTFIYLSVFKKDHIDRCLKIMMLFVFIITLVWGIFGMVDDLLLFSSKEISITEKRGIFVSWSINCPLSSPLLAVCSAVAILTDFVYIALLLYRFAFGVKQVNNYYSDGVKAIILLSVASAVFLVVFAGVGLDLEAKFLFNNISAIADTVCLYLMFAGNQQIFDNLCGCCCANCCGQCCFGSKYQPVQVNDDEDNENQQLNV